MLECDATHRTQICGWICKLQKSFQPYDSIILLYPMYSSGLSKEKARSLMGHAALNELSMLSFLLLHRTKGESCTHFFLYIYLLCLHFALIRQTPGTYTVAHLLCTVVLHLAIQFDLFLADLHLSLSLNYQRTVRPSMALMKREVNFGDKCIKWESLNYTSQKAQTIVNGKLPKTCESQKKEQNKDTYCLQLSTHFSAFSLIEIFNNDIIEVYCNRDIRQRIREVKFKKELVN